MGPGGGQGIAGRGADLEEALRNLPSTPLTVGADGIAAALTQTWQECSDAAGPDGLSRTLTMNFIAVGREQAEQRFMETCGYVLDRHPCRAFLLVMSDSNEPIVARVQGTLQQHGRRGTAMVLEKIAIRGDWREFDKLPGVIRPLLVADIPVQLFWMGDLQERIACFTALAKMADQAIVDSGGFRDPETDIDTLAALRRESSAPITDITWLRLRPWRRALAEAFEHFAWHPGEQTEVQIEHGRDGCGLAAARCLSDWLGERLSATTTFAQVASDTDHCEPLALTLRWTDVTIRVRRQCPKSQLQTTVMLDNQCLLPTCLPASQGCQGDLLGAAVELTV